MCTKSVLPYLFSAFLLPVFNLSAQQTSVAMETHEDVFGELLLIDNQTVHVPRQGIFDVDIQQRFGTMTNGLEDLLGIYAPSNTRIGLYYVPLNRLMVGAGLTRQGMQMGIEVKYRILNQGRWPVALSYFANASVELEENSHFHQTSERLSYFNQLLIARHFNHFSLQAGPSLSHFNKVVGSGDEVADTVNFCHFAVSFLGQYRLSHRFSLIAEYDMPLTRHAPGKTFPNISMGVQLVSGKYCLQFFAENYGLIDAQNSQIFNRNDFSRGQFLLGFNISRSWNFSRRRAVPHS